MSGRVRRGALEPVWLGAAGCDRLSLRVQRYEFPGHAAPGDIDSNWLVIEGQVERADERWSFCDPCMLTSELREMIEWLTALPRPGQSGVECIEPVVALSVREDDPDWTLRARLRLEGVPACVLAADEWGKGVELLLASDARQRDRFAERLCHENGQKSRRTQGLRSLGSGVARPATGLETGPTRNKEPKDCGP